MRLQPDWVADLALAWAREDWTDVAQALGYPSVSPIFKRVAGADSSDDVTGYSHSETRAMAAAMEWLHLRHYEHWRALARELRPHLRDKLPAREGDADLIEQAGPMLAEYIDQVLG
jgi:hypothetical protein